MSNDILQRNGTASEIDCVIPRRGDLTQNEKRKMFAGFVPSERFYSMKTTREN